MMSLGHFKCTIHTQLGSVLDLSGQIRGGTRVVARMRTGDRIDVQHAQAFAELGCRDEILVNRLTVEQPRDVDGEVAENDGALDAGRFAKVDALGTKIEGRDFRRD